MPTNVKTSTMALPFSLGAIKPGAGFATASAPLTQNIVPVLQDGVSPVRMFNGIFIQAWPGNSTTPTNSAPIYVCNNASAPDLVNFTNVVAILMPGDSFPRSKEWSENRDIGTLFIGAENATDFALVTIDGF